MRRSLWNCLFVGNCAIFPYSTLGVTSLATQHLSTRQQVACRLDNQVKTHKRLQACLQKSILKGMKGKGTRQQIYRVFKIERQEIQLRVESRQNTTIYSSERFLECLRCSGQQRAYSTRRQQNMIEGRKTYYELRHKTRQKAN